MCTFSIGMALLMFGTESRHGMAIPLQALNPHNQQTPLLDKFALNYFYKITKIISLFGCLDVLKIHVGLGYK